MIPPAIRLVGQRSRSRIAPFRLHRPASVEEAADACARANGGAAFMAGGLDLIGAMKAGVRPSEVVHLGRVAELSRIALVPGGVRIGAGVTHAELADHPVLQARIPDVVQAWNALGNPRIRFTGTLGGNLMARNPAYDASPVLMALDATLTFAGPGGERRRLAAADLAAAEGLLVAVEIPGREHARMLLDRSLRPVATVALGLHFQDGLVGRAVVAVGCAYPQVQAWPIAMSRPLTLAQLRTQAARLAEVFAAKLPAPADDWRAGSAYRRKMIGVILGRLLARAQAHTHAC